jgi:hypothetical protein
MSESKITVVAPKPLHPHTLFDEAQRFALDLQDGRKVVWCPVNRVGAIYYRSGGLWISEGPLGFMEFLQGLSAVGIEMAPDESAAKRWVGTCLANEVASHVLRSELGDLPYGDSVETSLQLPKVPSATTLRDPRYTILDASGTRLVTWCPREQSGGVCHLEPRIWATLWPIDFASFLRWLSDRGVHMEQSEDLARWVDACTEVTGGQASGRC